MSPTNPASILRIHVCETDTYDGRPLFEAVVSKCRELQIAGATVFRGLEGYGETAEIHRRHLMTSDQPIVIVVVDAPAIIDRLVPVVEEMMGTGVIAVSQADMIRVRKPTV